MTFADCVVLGSNMSFNAGAELATPSGDTLNKLSE